tara:strand:+ start:1544 stop:1957 length:414 start_codon:yes stop_codon:yes gene_type:complete
MNKINIRQFKLLNGEEIIALVSQKEDKSFILERPFVIKANMLGGYAFVPWFPFSSQKLFKIEKNFIMHHVELDEDVKTEYIRLAANLSKPVIKDSKIVQGPTDEEILKEFDQFVEDTIDEYGVDDFIEMTEKKRTLH